jgi:hypothetical protein
MAQYRKIYCRIWHDDKFPQLSDDAQLVWFHSYTANFSTGIGLYTCSIEGLAGNKRWPVDRYRKAFSELSERGLVAYDAEYQTVLFPRFFRHNKPENPNVLAGLLKKWDDIPDCPHRRQLREILELECRCWGKGYLDVLRTFAGTDENVSQTFREQEHEQHPETHQEQERDQERESGRARARRELATCPPNGTTETATFESAWRIYPRRSGSNAQAEARAKKEWQQRLSDGHSAEELLAGARRYAAYCDATGNTGTQYVMHPARFFGAEKHFLEQLDPPARPNKVKSGSAAEWLAAAESEKRSALEGDYERVE